MGRWGSLEFGRKGPEGIKGEGTDFNNVSNDDEIETEKIEDIKKLLDEIDGDDFEDCGKTPKEIEEENMKKLLDEIDEDDFQDCLKKSTKTVEEILEDDVESYEGCLEEAEKEMKRLNEAINKIFDI